MSKVGLFIDQLNKVLAELPAYVEVDLTLDNRGFADTEVHRLMARDWPGPERRFTNLTTGSEWFLPLSADLGITGISIPAQEWEVG